MSNIQFRGSNLAGGDVPFTKWQGRELQKDSDYLFVKTTDIDYLLSKGCNFFRLLFSWEALQPTPFAAIPGAGGFGVYYQQIKTLVDYATSKGATVCIDIHNAIDSDFAAYYNQKIGTTYQGHSVETLFVDLWTKLANIFKSNPAVWFGIVNEPSFMPTLTWFAAAQKVVTAIRATGAQNKILMPGNGFTAASTWTGNLYSDTGVPTRSNAYGWLNARGPGLPLIDPLNNTAIQVHLYGDVNAGGGALDVVSPTILVERTKVVVDWARANKLQVFVAEVGIPAASTNATAAWKNFVTYLEANADVLLGFAWWAYGPPAWWGGYKFALSPKTAGAVDSPQMDMIEPALLAPVVVTPVDPTITLKAEIAALKAALTLEIANHANTKSVLTEVRAAFAALRTAYDLLDGQHHETLSTLETTALELKNANTVIASIKELLS